MRCPNLFDSLIRLLIGSLSIDAMIDICHMAGPNRWRSVMGGHLGIFRLLMRAVWRKKRLPRMIFNYVDGAASDEKAAKLNLDRLSDLRLMPRVLSNVGTRRLTGQILGMDVGLPFGIASMGMCNLSWPGGDRALAWLAATHQIPLCVSTAASTPLETMIEMAEGHGWFQLDVGHSSAFVLNLSTAPKRLATHNSFCPSPALADLHL